MKPSPAALSETDVDRYARQIIVPGIGANGQARLLKSALCVLGDRDAAADLARRYALAAGLRLTDAPAAADCVVLAGAERTELRARTAVARAGTPIVWYALDGDALRSGVALAPAELPEPRREVPAVDRGSPPSPADRVRCAVGACDAVATAVALLLDWPVAGTERETRLG